MQYAVSDIEETGSYDLSFYVYDTVTPKIRIFSYFEGTWDEVNVQTTDVDLLSGKYDMTLLFNNYLLLSHEDASTDMVQQIQLKQWNNLARYQNWKDCDGKYSQTRAIW
jgi:hypothetical protein